jgi:clan AA aspartic protease (TIGR02281 family)
MKTSAGRVWCSCTTKLALASCSLLAIGVSASAQSATAQCSTFEQIRIEAQDKASAVRTAIEHKAERQEICAVVQRFYAAEGIVVKFLEDNKTECRVPEQAIDTAKENHERTLKFRTAACTEGNGAPSVGMADHGSRAPVSVPMQIEGGIYVVRVLINNAIALDFVVDSGAADVSIPADVAMTLMRTGTLKKSDFLGEKTYLLADGSTVPSQTFSIRSLKVGSKVLENVTGSIASVKGSLLLGQSFLSRFKSWSVDNAKHALLLSE